MNCIYKVGDIVLANVVEVKPYAAFITMPGDIQGMIHISELSDSYIRDIDKFVSVGDELSVIILSIDDSDHFLRTSFKKVPLNQQYTTHTNARRALPNDEEDFDSLKRSIPEWIKESLQRHSK